MGVSDARRLEVYEQARAQWGDGPAEALMEMVVPAGQDMATRQDVEHAAGLLRSDIEAGIALLRSDIEAEIALLRADMDASIALLRADMDASIALLRADMDASIALLRADMDVRFARIEERMSGLASKEYVLRALIVGLLPVYGMLIGLLFGMYAG